MYFMDLFFLAPFLFYAQLSIHLFHKIPGKYIEIWVGLRVMIIFTRPRK